MSDTWVVSASLIVFTVPSSSPASIPPSSIFARRARRAAAFVSAASLTHARPSLATAAAVRRASSGSVGSRWRHTRSVALATP